MKRLKRFITPAEADLVLFIVTAVVLAFLGNFHGWREVALCVVLLTVIDVSASIEKWRSEFLKAGSDGQAHD